MPFELVMLAKKDRRVLALATNTLEDIWPVPEGGNYIHRQHLLLFLKKNFGQKWREALASSDQLFLNDGDDYRSPGKAQCKPVRKWSLCGRHDPEALIGALISMVFLQTLSAATRR